MMDVKEKGNDENYEQSAFEELEKDFQEVLQELVGDKSLEHFRLEYEKLHRALKKSHESEKRLIKKCRELNAEIVANAVKVQTALKLSQEDQSTISSLKREIERAWKMVEASHEKEQRAKDTISNLKHEITQLSKLVEQGAGLSINQENTVNNLVQQKNDLFKHRNMLEGQVLQLTAQNTELHSRVRKLDSEKVQEEAEIKQVKDSLAQKKAEAEANLARKERLDRDLKDLRTALDNRHSDIRHRTAEIDQQTNKIAELEIKVMEHKVAVDQGHAKHQQMEDAINQAKHHHDDEVTARKKNEVEHRSLQQQYDAKCQDVVAAQTKRDKTVANYQKLMRQKEAEDKTRETLEQSKNQLKSDVEALIAEVAVAKRQQESDAKSIVDMLHERDMLTKAVVRSDEQSKKQTDLVGQHEGRANMLEKDVLRWKKALSTTLKRVHELKKQREKNSVELSMSNSRYVTSLEELKARDAELAQLKEQIQYFKEKLKQQKNLYELVRANRNLYSKNYLESQDEIAEMKRKFKTMYHQIEQLKEEIKEKDQQIIKEHVELDKVTKTSDHIQAQLQSAQKSMHSLQNIVDQQRMSVKKLESTISEAEQERQRQKKEFEGVVCERDILGTQLIRRNEELDLLYEKIKIQQSTLLKGEHQYNEKTAVLKALNADVGARKRELYVARESANFIDDLKREVHHLHREVLQEQNKVKALSEELENPINVHRWRKLESSDPATYELIQKVNTLQKRLIAKTQEVVDKDSTIQQKEAEYSDLKTQLARQPGPEVKEHLLTYEEHLREKQGQMSVMTQNLERYQLKASEYRDEADRLTRELQEVKRKFLSQKRQAQASDAKRNAPPPTKVQPILNPNLPRFTGGGFNLSV
jgi:chromosome segregation ATPase